MPSQESNQPTEPLRNGYDVLYSDHGEVRRVKPKNPNVNPLKVMTATYILTEILANELYPDGYNPRELDRWTYPLVKEIAAALQLEMPAVYGLLPDFRKMVGTMTYISNGENNSWGFCRSLESEQLIPFITKGIERLHETNTAAQHSGQDERGGPQDAG